MLIASKKDYDIHRNIASNKSSCTYCGKEEANHVFFYTSGEWVEDAEGIFCDDTCFSYHTKERLSPGMGEWTQWKEEWHDGLARIGIYSLPSFYAPECAWCGSKKFIKIFKTIPDDQMTMPRAPHQSSDFFCCLDCYGSYYGASFGEEDLQEEGDAVL